MPDWRRTMQSVIFIAGVYGVGKSTLCNKLSLATGIPSFSAGDLISEVNGEMYGRNKVVKDVKSNQDILVSAINSTLEIFPRILLAGHFCIVNKYNDVELLPKFVFAQLHLSSIILLETEITKIFNNIRDRDQRIYPINTIDELIAKERSQAQTIAKELNIPLFLHSMKYDHSDEKTIAEVLTGGCKNESSP